MLPSFSFKLEEKIWSYNLNKTYKSCNLSGLAFTPRWLDTFISSRMVVVRGLNITVFIGRSGTVSSWLRDHHGFIVKFPEKEESGLGKKSGRDGPRSRFSRKPGRAAFCQQQPLLSRYVQRVKLGTPRRKFLREALRTLF